MKKQPSVIEHISALYPDLIGMVRASIKKSEKEYNRSNCQEGESFLWDHTLQVAAFTMRLSHMEGVDPSIPVITALFHDAGKFIKGKYHMNDKPEEDYAASIARRILKKVSMPQAQINEVESALKALYQDRSSCFDACRIVHDADFLDKFGAIGIANFFMKSTLRGKPLSETILTMLSKELTYSSSASYNMMTRSGKKLAVKRSAESLKYYRSLLNDLREFNIGSYAVNKIRLDKSTRPAGSRIRDNIDIYLVEPETCGSCSGGFVRTFTRNKGVKCEKLTACLECSSCGYSYEIAFCLPEICRGCV